MPDEVEPSHLGDFSAGFGGYYRPEGTERAQVYRNGIIALDTSALLDLYRLSPKARTDLLDVLESIKERLFVPYQVALEFHRRRVDAVEERMKELKGHADQIVKNRNDAIGLVGQIARRAHGKADEAREIEKALDLAFDAMQSFLKSVQDDYDLNPDSLVGTPASGDPVFVRLNEILHGRVAPRPPQETLTKDLVEANRRSEGRLPPGFKDASKADGVNGDYMWWAEVVRYAQQVRPSAVLIVSNDVSKGDWTYDKRGLRVGPHLALIEELASASGAQLLLATTSELLAEAAYIAGAAVSPDSVQEAEGLPVEPSLDPVLDPDAELRRLVARIGPGPDADLRKLVEGIAVADPDAELRRLVARIGPGPDADLRKLVEGIAVADPYADLRRLAERIGRVPDPNADLRKLIEGIAVPDPNADLRKLVERIGRFPDPNAGLRKLIEGIAVPDPYADLGRLAERIGFPDPTAKRKIVGESPDKDPSARSEPDGESEVE